MKILSQFLFSWLTVTSSMGLAQEVSSTTTSGSKPDSALAPQRETVVITGARFCYALIQKWIDEYERFNPNVHVMIAPRSLSDPLTYDILAEVYEPDEAVRDTRVFLNVGRYAILPVTTTGSPLATAYADKGLDANLIKHIFFGDIFGENDQRLKLLPFTVYTRLQTAGVPAVFSSHFGYEQKDLRGTAIAGSDAHLLEAMLRDSTGVTYLPLPLIYNRDTQQPTDGLTILPVDIDGQRKLSDHEKFYGNLNDVIGKLEREGARRIKNIPVEHVHFSIKKEHANPEAIAFLRWISEQGLRHLHRFGFLLPEDQDVNAFFRELNDNKAGLSHQR